METFHERVRSSFDKQGLMQTLGAKLSSVTDGEVQIILPFSPHLSQQHGYLHAGAITSIVDSACGYAALTRAPEGYEVVTAEFKVNLMRPAIGDGFIAIGRVQNAGKMLSVCTGEVRKLEKDGTQGKAIALIQATIVNVKSEI